MDDYQINKRLAEIAGVPVGWPSDEFGQEGSAMKMPHKQGLWSPLTDWSQLGPMLERFPVDCEWVHQDPTAEVVWSCDKEFEQHRDLKRAICLAIIAAHEEE